MTRHRTPAEAQRARRVDRLDRAWRAADSAVRAATKAPPDGPVHVARSTPAAMTADKTIILSLEETHALARAAMPRHSAKFAETRREHASLVVAMDFAAWELATSGSMKEMLPPTTVAAVQALVNAGRAWLRAHNVVVMEPWDAPSDALTGRPRNPAALHSRATRRLSIPSLPRQTVSAVPAPFSRAEPAKPPINGPRPAALAATGADPTDAND